MGPSPVPPAPASEAVTWPLRTHRAILGAHAATGSQPP
jgi:hypothetical protein